jgi:hypothetical protein
MAEFKRLNTTALEQIITSDINSIGDFHEEGDASIILDALGYTDGVLSGLLPVAGTEKVTIAADGKLLQDGLIGTSEATDVAVTLPLAGTRIDIIVAQITETDENYVPRLFLVDPDSETQITTDTYVESTQRVSFDWLEDTIVVPVGWILLATLSCDATTITVTDSRDFSTGYDAKTFLSDVDNYGFIKGMILNEGAVTLNDISALSVSHSSDFDLTLSDSGGGVANLDLALTYPAGTIQAVNGTSGTGTDINTLTFAAGTGISSVIVGEAVQGIATITLNASAGGSGGVLLLTPEVQTGVQGILTGGKYRFTLAGSYTVGGDNLVVYRGGQRLCKGLDYDEVGAGTSQIVDLYDETEPTNNVCFDLLGSTTSFITGMNISGDDGGAGGTDIQTLVFDSGDNINLITVTEAPGGTATVTIDAIDEKIGTITGSSGTVSDVKTLNVTCTDGTVAASSGGAGICNLVITPASGLALDYEIITPAISAPAVMKYFNKNYESITHVPEVIELFYRTVTTSGSYQYPPICTIQAHNAGAGYDNEARILFCVGNNSTYLIAFATSRNANDYHITVVGVAT